MPVTMDRYVRTGSPKPDAVCAVWPRDAAVEKAPLPVHRAADAQQNWMW